MLDELATGWDLGGFWLWFWMAGILKETVQLNRLSMLRE